jgi:DNA invertase Pin-like site-specific DNA recombinase
MESAWTRKRKKSVRGASSTATNWQTFMRMKDISGTKADRPGLAAALSAVGKGDALVVYSLSRLARSTAHTLEISTRLDKVGADLGVTIGKNRHDISKLARWCFGCWLYWLSSRGIWSAERTTTALQHKKRKGERTGSIPLGKWLAEDGVHLVDEQGEQMAIEAARVLKDQGLSLRKIALELEHQGLLSRTKKRFDAKQIQRMIA